MLDRLLEEPWLEIDGISGTSAGAMNAAVLVHGHQKGGAAGAREALEAFWRRVSDAARFSPFQRGPLDMLLGRWTLDSSPIYVAMDLMSRLVSPYDVNPLGMNPLRDILAEVIDFEVLAQSPIHLFITATNVRTGRGKVFKNDAITPGRPARLGLPADDVPGDRDRRRGLLGRRLFRQSDAYPADPRMQIAGHDSGPDQSRSSGRAIPRSASEILNRLNEVSFNAVVLKELRMMALLRKVADPGDGEGALWAQMRIHLIREHDHDRTRRVLEAQRGMGVLHLPARRGAKSRAGVSGRARDGSRQALDARSRRSARGI